MLNVRGLSVEFHTATAAVRVLDDVSFDVVQGETLAIVGESGSGKTVTALALMRLLPPAARISAGEIRFDGHDLLTLSEEEMRRHRGNRLAMVFQDPMAAFNPALTIGTQVAEPLECHSAMPRSAALARAEELLSEVQIPDAAHHVRQYPHQLSGGMRQRAMVATARACHPRLIIADEPTTALDVTVQAQILDLLKRTTRETGAALILITHDLGIVARYADRVCIMYAGRIVELGTARELYRRPTHPYTRGLLECVPRLDRPAGAALTPIVGQPPRLDRLPSGCAFHPRCPKADDRCRHSRPLMTPVGGEQWRACFAAVER